MVKYLFSALSRTLSDRPHHHEEETDNSHEHAPLLSQTSPGAHPQDTSRRGDPTNVSFDGSSTLSFPSSASSAERSRTLRQRNAVRYASFACAIISCLCGGSITAYSLYGHIFQERLGYTQLQVNSVSIAGELAMYLPVPIFGYVCDRVGPAPLSLFSGIIFGVGYTLAAFTYRSGATDLLDLGLYDDGVPVDNEGWPFGVMILAFVLIGMGTTSMYLSAVTTCAKNFGRGAHKGLALAAPIAAFGLSGMWQSQIGARLLYETTPDGSRGDVDTFKYFCFLAVLLLAVGLLGSVGLKVVDEDEMIDDAMEALNESGYLENSAFFAREENARNYGAISEGNVSNEALDVAQRSAHASKARHAAKDAYEERKKTFLLNEETRLFLQDPTMWLLAGGLFLVTGPGEAFINNLGTIIGTLYDQYDSKRGNPNNQTSAATHVSIVAVTSTLARLITGTLTDILAPKSEGHANLAASISSLPASRLHNPHGVDGVEEHEYPFPRTLARRRLTISRVTFLLTFSLLLSLGQVLLASGLIQGHAERFWLVSGLIGAGYGAVFSIVPIIVSVIWGVENFGTNWGIVSMVPAVGATVWGVAYSWVYQRAASRGLEGLYKDILCFGSKCYAPTFWAMSVSVWIACGMWTWAWLGPGGWKRRGIAV